MKILRFYNEDNTIDVAYKVDLINDSDQLSNLTVMDVIGLDANEIEKGINFKLLKYNLSEFKKFAIDNELALSSQEVGSTVDKSPVILVELPEQEEPEEPSDD